MSPISFEFNLENMVWLWIFVLIVSFFLFLGGPLIRGRGSRFYPSPPSTRGFGRYNAGGGGGGSGNNMRNEEQETRPK